MKKIGLSFLILSLPAVVGLFPFSAANAGLRVSNANKVAKQGQMDAMALAASMPAEPQPARTVTNENGVQITVSDEQMNACSSIYPNGAFDWLQPQSGRMRGGPATCVADIELRAYSGGGTSYTVLAHTYLAAGDVMKCNIDEFPESGITPSGFAFTYPADNAPTLEDVAATMAKENKSNAGWKILGAAIVGGLGGNLVGANDPGKDSALGTDKGKLKTTAIGAAGAAALMTASTMSNNYKAGSIILSTGVNAAAGAVAGNLLGTGDEVVKFGPCKLKEGDIEKEFKNCIYGSVQTGTEQDFKPSPDYAYFYTQEDEILSCKRTKTAEGVEDPNNFENCGRHRMLKNINIIQNDCNDECKKLLLNDDVDRRSFDNIKKNVSKVTPKCKLITSTNSKNANDTVKCEENNLPGGDGKQVYKIISAQEAGSRRAAFIIPDKSLENKIFGYTKWIDVKKQLGNVKIVGTDGNVLKNKNEDYSLEDFSPAWQDADDGDNVDFGNKARAKATMIGAGGGAALGALSGASGAETEIQERFVAAQREYEDSLSAVSCGTGGRWMSKYNDPVEIPNMKIQQ